MFPKEVGEFTYADLKGARKFPWFGQLKEQLLPSHFRDFEKFLASAGVDPNTQVDELAWGGISATKTSSEEVVGVALGAFNPSPAKTTSRSQKLPMIDYHGYHMYAFGRAPAPATSCSCTLTRIPRRSAAVRRSKNWWTFGPGPTESLLSNDLIFPLINEAERHGLIWAVLNKDYAHMALHAVAAGSESVRASGADHGPHQGHDDLA